MDDEQKKAIAVFRFGVISDLVTTSGLSPGEKKRLLGEKCGRKWTIPYSEKSRLSKSTILRWAKKYKDAKGRLESLYPKSRQDNGQSRAIDDETGAILIEWKKLHPEYSIKLLIDNIRKKGALPPEAQFSLSAVYRFFHAHGLMDKSPKPVDRRKFEAELPNDLWQSDVMHGPLVQIGLKKKKTYLFVFLDDHSRFIPYARFHLSENTENCLNAFEASLMRLEAFAEIHTIIQFEKDSKPYLPLILAGQSNLIDKLAFRDSQPLASRVAARSHFEGADLDEMTVYLKHHQAAAGLKDDPFEPEAAAAIQQGSGGVFRKANHLARGALMAAAEQKVKSITADHVRLAEAEIF